MKLSRISPAARQSAGLPKQVCWTAPPLIRTRRSAAAGDSANPFADCSPDVLEAVLWAYRSGIASGVSETEFAPDRACTRAELITFLWRTAGCWPESDEALPFEDTAAGGFYSAALAWAVEYGIVSAEETRFFLPDTPCSQTDALLYLYRCRNRADCPDFLIRDSDGWRFQADSGWAADNWLIRDGRYYHFNADGLLDRVTSSAPALVSIPGYYIHPMKASVYSSREERVEAMISTAYEYLGDPFVVYRSTAPHTDGVDCSGLVMQCLYAAGFDPYPATPEHHSYTEYDSRTLWNEVDMPHIDPGELQRGDLVFYKKKQTSALINHIAIYLGNGKVIEAWPDRVTDCYQVAGWPHKIIYGAARPIA